MKIGQNHRYAGAESFEELLNDHKLCFAYVTKVSTVNQLESAAKGIRELDLLEETLGMYRKLYDIFFKSITDLSNDFRLSIISIVLNEQTLCSRANDEPNQ